MEGDWTIPLSVTVKAKQVQVFLDPHFQRNIFSPRLVVLEKVLVSRLRFKGLGLFSDYEPFSLSLVCVWTRDCQLRLGRDKVNTAMTDKRIQLLPCYALLGTPGQVTPLLSQFSHAEL